MTMKNQLELVTATFNDKEKPVWASFNKQWEPVWASYSQFQWQGKTGLSQFFEKLVCLCHAQQPLSTMSKNQFEQVTASLNDKKKPVWASYSQFQQPGRTSLS